MKKTLAILLTTGLTAGVASATSIMTSVATPANFGSTAGVGVQFDATPVAAGAASNIAIDGLVAGTTYTLDSITLTANNQATSTTQFFLGVYTGLVAENTGVTTVSGFQGVSDQAFDFSLIGEGNNISYTFSGITFTSNADLADTSDLRFFVLQESTMAITELPAIPVNTTGIQRLANAADIDSRVGIIQTPNNVGVGLRLDRAPLIDVGFTAVPEPSSFALALLSGIFAITRRRR